MGEESRLPHLIPLRYYHRYRYYIPIQELVYVVVVVTAPIFFLHDVIWRLHSVERSYLVTISNLGRASTKFVASTLMVGVLGEGVAEVGA